jgi:hypothetical protein
MNSRLILLTLLAFAAYSQEQGKTQKTGSPQMAVYARMSLAKQANGIDGELQVLQDARLTPSLRDQLWGTGDAGAAPASLRDATVRLVRSDGSLVQAEQLERPLARLESDYLYADRRSTYLLTVDYSAGFGSYSGPATFLLEVKSGRLSWIEAKDPRSGRTERISLADTLKSAWKIVGARTGSGKDLLQALCRPDFETEGEFKIIYIRYFYDGKVWQERVRETKGFSEFEDGFPDIKLFP